MIKNFDIPAIIASDRNICYREFLQRIDLFSNVLGGHDCCRDIDTLGMTTQEMPKILIFSENREGWIYAFFSVWQKGFVAVPVDATATVEDVAYIINDCRPVAAWTSKKNLRTLHEAMESAAHTMATMLIDDYERTESLDAQADLTDAITALEMPKPDGRNCQTAVIVYTSGTTGSPKGVMLSYENLDSVIRSVSIDVPIITPDRTLIMLLPVHHILPLMASVIVPFTSNSSVAICPSMAAQDIMQTLCRGKVGVFVGVPRLWQTLYNGIRKKIDEKAVTRWLFALCKKVGSKSLSRFIFQSVHKKMGGHIDYFVSGGAALDCHVAEGLRTLGFEVLEGYGMTETSPIISFTRPGDVIPGSVGLPMPATECKIINGELCARGVNVMQGYYNRPEETAAVIDKDGFIHTGDLARFDEKGRLYITGRSKEIIVLSNGKNVQPNEIESKLEQFTTQVKEAAITQNGDMLCAIIVPQDDWARGKTATEQQDLIKEQVLQPYNLTVENYKKVMSLFIYHGDLPRTKLDKLQRFKLQDIVRKASADNSLRPRQDSSAPAPEEETREYLIIKKYIEDEKNITVHPHDHIETDLAFDSLDKVSLQGFIEQTFGMTVRADEMDSFRDILDMTRHVAAHSTRTEATTSDWHAILSEEIDPAVHALPTASASHKAFTKLSKAFFCLYNSLTIKGTENIPLSGPFIIAPNHQSFLDGPLVMVGIPDSLINDCYFYATEEHVQGNLRRRFASHHNIILMERRNLKHSIQKLSVVLRQGKNIVIFPEGARTHTGKVGNFKKTFAILSKELNVPILPVRLTGAYSMLKRGTHFIRPCHVEVEYLPAIRPDDSKSYEDLATEVKKAIEGRW